MTTKNFQVFTDMFYSTLTWRIDEDTAPTLSERITFIETWLEEYKKENV